MDGSSPAAVGWPSVAHRCARSGQPLAAQVLYRPAMASVPARFLHDGDIGFALPAVRHSKARWGSTGLGYNIGMGCGSRPILSSAAAEPMGCMAEAWS